MKTIFLTIITLLLTSTAHTQNKAEIVRQITQTAQVAGIDPDVAVAIAMVESSLNPKAIGGLGEIGLFQLRPEYHVVVLGDTKQNITAGVGYLLFIKTNYKNKYGNAWFVLFNTGPYRPPKDPKATKYYQKVMREVGQLKFKRFIAAR